MFPPADAAQPVGVLVLGAADGDAGACEVPLPLRVLLPALQQTGVPPMSPSTQHNYSSRVPRS